MSSSIRSAYTQWSDTYDSDRNLTRDLDASITRSILSNRRYSNVLELGCGTGKNISFLLSIADHVHALDFSQGMLARARAKNLGPRVTFTQADLTHSWPIADHSANLIICNLVLEHIPDLSPIFSQASRTLASSGHFFISELHPYKQYLGGKARYHHSGATIELPSFTHHISDFLNAAASAGLTLLSLQEPRHPDDKDTPPRLAVFLFTK